MANPALEYTKGRFLAHCGVHTPGSAPPTRGPTMVTPWDLIARLQEQVDDLSRRVAALEASPRVSDAE